MYVAVHTPGAACRREGGQSIKKEPRALAKPQSAIRKWFRCKERRFVATDPRGPRRRRGVRRPCVPSE